MMPSSSDLEQALQKLSRSAKSLLLLGGYVLSSFLSPHCLLSMLTPNVPQRSSVKSGENVQYSTKHLSVAQQTLDGASLRIPR